MRTKIKFHKFAWECPVCGEYKRVRNNARNVRMAKCCGRQFKIKTGAERREVIVLVITDVEAI